MVYERLDCLEEIPAIPEYPDKGCKLFNSCLNCPYPFCVYDMSYDGARLLKEWRNAEIIRRSSAGAAVKDLQQTFNLSRTSIFRILKYSGQPGSRKLPKILKEVTK